MPPALSDHDSSGEEEIPPVKKGKMTKQAKPVEEVEENEDQEEADDEYIVERIMGHKFVKGELVFNVKWQGYDDPKDQTWEPEANMAGAIDVMNEYFDELGGRPEPKGPGKRKGRPSGANKSGSGTPASTAKRVKQDREWSPPHGSWEDDVDYIDTVEEKVDPRTGELSKFAYLVWKNDKKTQHPLKHIYQKCPQKMLLYYESHLVFTQTHESLNGDDDSMKDVY
ncbi:hypothetical protein HBI56_052130 [Parastagonospora nodorum]|uniref:Chromo domain-containing protein n=1 Tax=Phaeosphaeria nodorum (strain SN15 / ATCC MYA-4574 / FGSC 10173) TaxID=321614 RepID=A0A7U2NR60_PHANO|nr:hypothetical protein HBH56_100020 [Parastagonospora nodorum]QRD07500.1 hypothetical protein JI435_131150 [Parastagonospora nodorum SN15]KAH3930493.1 hypothetical protein HBH54_114340 [Parastagonospora nodorum]KAH3942878.1 hypothetical protein HBH53_181620 [Parastagonospora nodorum]KAH3964483.1 hypothetical protein HBH51_157720 [Parastagonospora nodorum]